MLKITLRTPQGDKSYTQDFISGRMFRRTVAMQGELRGTIDETALDKMVDYVVELFSSQFTVDEFYDGIASDKLIDTVTNCINTVTGKAQNAIGPDSGSPNV